MLAVYPNGNRKKLATTLGISRQAVDQRVNKGSAISYSELAKLAADPNANPEAIPLGALEMIASVRAQGSVFDLAARADDWMSKAQQHDGTEDCAQLSVKAVLASFAFMHEDLSLPFRTNATAALEKWRACKRAEMQADLAALGYVDALIAKLSPVEGR